MAELDMFTYQGSPTEKQPSDFVAKAGERLEMIFNKLQNLSRADRNNDNQQRRKQHQTLPLRMLEPERMNDWQHGKLPETLHESQQDPYN